MVPLKLHRVWRGHLYLSADAWLLAPPSFSITTISQSLYQQINVGWLEKRLKCATPSGDSALL